MAMAILAPWTVICAATERGKYEQTTSHCNHHRVHRQSQLQVLSLGLFFHKKNPN
jgi:hypothetical protein